MLPDHRIRDLNLVSPFRADLLQPASYDLTLGANCATFPPEVPPGFTIGKDKPCMIYNHDWDVWRVKPRELVLFETAETIYLPNSISGKFEGKSSLGRIGLMTHITSGFIDPGFVGVLTLEVYNCGPYTLYLTPGMRIGQVAFTRLDTPAQRPYGSPGLGSHYQGSGTVTGGRFDDRAS